MERTELEQWQQRLRGMLLEGVMGFWKERTLDRDSGGYVTAFDRQGNILNREKNMWLHGRQTWMFSVLYQDIDRNPAWLELAKATASALVPASLRSSGTRTCIPL